MDTNTEGEDMSSDIEAQEREIAHIITDGVAGSRWRELDPIDIARHLVANGVRVVVKVERDVRTKLTPEQRQDLAGIIERLRAERDNLPHGV